MSGAPLLVYLDSSDFIDLTRAASDEKIRKLYDHLLDLKAQGVCRFGVSFLHIVEVLNPDSSGFEEDQRRYGGVINSLTDGDSFPFINDAVEGAIFPNEKMWLPRSVSSAVLNLDYVKNFWPAARRKAMQMPGLSGKMRRQIGSKPWMRELVRKHNVEVPPELAGLGFSFSDFREVLLDPSKHAGRMRDKIFRVLSNPEMFCDVVSRTNPGENPFLKIIKEKERPIHDSITVSILYMKTARQQQKAVEERLRKLQDSLNECGLDSALKGEIKSLKIQMKKATKIPKSGVADRIGNKDFLYVDHYIDRVMRQDRVRDASEIRDLLHLYYANHVDLIRVDKRMFEMMKGYEPFKHRLVRLLADLPEAIERKALSGGS